MDDADETGGADGTDGADGAGDPDGTADAPTDDGTDPAHVVTAFLRNRGEVLLLRRSDAVGTYRGKWGGVSGYAEGDPDAQVRREIAEETGLADAVTLVRAGAPVRVADDEGSWVVHPYLLDCDAREVTLSEEHDAADWVPATEILRRETVPALWTAYERVAPSVRSVAADGEHGSAYLSVRALEVLRDRAGLLAAEGAPAGEARGELADLARRLLRARPSMAALGNRVNRAMATAAADADGDGSTGGGEGTHPAGAVERAAVAGVERALAADADAAAAAAALVADERVLTLSRSGTVLDALRAGDPRRVFVAESRPAREGVDVAAALAGTTSVTLHTDAAAAHVLAEEDVDRVLVGADTVLADGRVVNKTGTRGVALAAVHDGVPVHAVAASDKVSPEASVRLESGARAAVYDGDADVDVLNPTFDVTPADAVTGVVTEDGVRDADDVAAVAAAHRERAAWAEAWDGDG